LGTAFPPRLLADVNDHAAATVYYPSEAGEPVLDFGLLLPLSVIAEDVTITLEMSVDREVWKLARRVVRFFGD